MTDDEKFYKNQNNTLWDDVRRKDKEIDDLQKRLKVSEDMNTVYYQSMAGMSKINFDAEKERIFL